VSIVSASSSDTERTEMSFMLKFCSIFRICKGGKYHCLVRRSRDLHIRRIGGAVG
jgi:hypothetical protein